MNITAIQNILRNYETITEDGNYNVDVTIFHNTVGVMVGYPTPDGGYGRQFFYPHEPHGHFPEPISLKRGDRLSYWTLLTKDVVSNGLTRLINFGVGAQETGDGMPPEVVEVSISPAQTRPVTSMHPLGEMPPLYYGSQEIWKYKLNELPNLPSGLVWEISIAPFGHKTLQQLSSVVFLVNGNNWHNTFVAGQNHSIFLRDDQVHSGDYYLCALIQGTRMPDGSLNFQVGDPEKDAKARMVRV